MLITFQGRTQENWLCVYPNKKVYFEDINKMVYCIRIDSTFNGDSIMYPFSDLHQIDEECFSISSGSWISKYIALNEAGNTIFVTSNNEQILIKNKAELNEIWSVFENENIKLKGQITSIELKSVLGIEDSVKIITFSTYDTDNVPINHSLNQASIEISKHFGLLKTISFYDFNSTKFNQYFDEFNLIGINEPQLGFQNINLMEQYYDFQVGDELHIWKEYTPILYDTSVVIEKIIFRYISRMDYEDSIVYSYERKINNNIPKDTLLQVINKDVFLFDTEPNEPYFDGVAFNKIVINNSLVPKMYSSMYPVYWETSSSCYRTLNVDGNCLAGYEYYPAYYVGLGGSYWECCYSLGNKTCYDLVYYKKGNTEVGTPFDFESSVPEYEKNTPFSVYPNPTSNYITIKSTSNENLYNNVVEIYDIQGRKQLTKQFHNSDIVDISFLNAGCYVIKLISENKNVNYLKLIKQ